MLCFVLLCFHMLIIMIASRRMRRGRSGRKRSWRKWWVPQWLVLSPHIQECHSFDSPWGFSVWGLHVPPRVCAASLQVLQRPPTVQRHARQANWQLWFGRRCWMFIGLYVLSKIGHVCALLFLSSELTRNDFSSLQPKEQDQRQQKMDGCFSSNGIVPFRHIIWLIQLNNFRFTTKNVQNVSCLFFFVPNVSREGKWFKAPGNQLSAFRVLICWESKTEWSNS